MHFFSYHNNNKEPNPSRKVWSLISTKMWLNFWFGILFTFSIATLSSLREPLASEAETPSQTSDQEEFSTQFLSHLGLTGTQRAISYTAEDLILTYGRYTELELKLDNNHSSHIEWNLAAGSMPPGIYLEDSTASKILLFGTPQFTDRWCFTVSATESGLEPVYEEICLVSRENHELDYPQFKVSSLLENVFENSLVSEKLAFTAKPQRSYKVVLEGSELPSGLRIAFDSGHQQVLLSGRTSEVGVYRFSVTLTDNFNNQNSRQYQIEVVAKEETPPTDTGGGNGGGGRIYQCPDGYYYEDSLGYCVQISGDSCPRGTYYDVNRNLCVQYPTPPPEISCLPGYYFDHFLGSCVRASYPRCPYNFSWDNYYGRCVRNYRSCMLGYRYNWYTDRCDRIYRYQDCGPDYYYDHSYNTCRPHFRGCPRGLYFDFNLNRCMPNHRGCGSGAYWDDQAHRCLPNRPFCPPGSFFDYGTRQCRSHNVPPRACPPGSHWAPQRNTCVPNLPNPPPPRPIGPMPWPMPMPHPMPIIPGPGPGPMPIVPMPMPHPMPIIPGPEPGPMPIVPMPMPHPMPIIPGPGPGPMPIVPMPMPHPMPIIPGPGPGPMPIVPIPMPHPMPIFPSPGPMPFPGPRPGPMVGPMFPMGMSPLNSGSELIE